MLFFFLSSAFSVGVYREYVLYQPYFWNSRYYRIPAITTANDGTLITATDMRWVNKNDLPARISTIINYSPDNGLTWTNPQIISGTVRDVGDGDPALVVDRKTGCVLCLWTGDAAFMRSTPQNPQHLYFTRSWDNGRTWEEKKDITHMIYSNLCTNCDEDRRTWSAMFFSSGSALQLRDGRIMVSGVTRCHGKHRCYCVYTDDLGKTWSASTSPAYSDKGDESKFFETNNGTVVLSTRLFNGPKARGFAWSYDRGMTFPRNQTMTDLWDSPCNGDVLRYTSTIDGYDKDRILHTLTYVQGFPRRNVSILISYDEGETWPVKKTIRANADDLGSYSSIAIGHDGLIHIYYEKGIERADMDNFNMTVVTLSLDWITDGADVYKKPENLRWCICEKEDAACNGKCPKDYHKLTPKVFDNYIDTYWEYPTNMNYFFPVEVRDFTVNLSVPGLNHGKYEADPSLSKRPKVKIVGSAPEPVTLEFINVDIEATVDVILANNFVLDGTALTIDDQISKVEVGTTLVKLTKGVGLEQTIGSVTVASPKRNQVKSQVNIINNMNGRQLEVYKGIDGAAGQENAGAPVKLSLPAGATDKTFHIYGIWSDAEASGLTLTSGKVITDKANENKFPIEGSNPPDFEYEGEDPQPTQGPPTQTPAPTVVPPTVVPSTAVPSTAVPPTAVPPTEAPTIEPTTPVTPQPTNTDSDQGTDEPVNKRTAATYLAIIGALATACVGLLIFGIAMFIKYKKFKSETRANDSRSESNVFKKDLLYYDTT
ncbi:hypothetical protein TRFO_14184 [Tritrichomonas foetus]|uniref:Sialidase domain-containing protein n=1 Tax=Tritrichomonas foetus TaxID=1144522 RepID=A0A1J4L0A9_9EUKA|nr:hypothetical protein TRFO_14184 [Tritrichomonas foetus]|eukprot:OHT15285.1 hypothetical protein TRFO_14184 [Tritrichomonas foetus]